MAKCDNISMSVIRRLPRYYRFLSELDNQNVERISSNKLAEIMHVTASQVRQDLNCFGGFGQQGYGYAVKQLKDEITNILGLNLSHPAILVGAGNLGKAIAAHMNFNRLGFELVGIFDKDSNIIGTSINGIKVQGDDNIESFAADNKVDTAFLCIPKSGVEYIVEKLYNVGIRSFWNFSHYDITNTFEDAIVENVHLSDSLMTLCYRMNENKEKYLGA